MAVHRRDRILIPGEGRSVIVTAVDESDPDEIVVVFERQDGTSGMTVLARSEYELLVHIGQTGGGDPVVSLSSLWGYWMERAAALLRSAALATTPLRPYPHQDDAVYTAMLHQPVLRFLLGDEPGTGKTIMAGLYIREMQRAGRLRKVLLAVPAHLIPKWERDFRRFFGIDVARITSDVAKRPERLHPDRDVWVVSVDLLARNSQVQQKAIFEPEAWDFVVFDEAHRLTPTAQTAFPVAQELSRRCTHLLLLTATPHRGNEYFFRALLHLLDPGLYPWSEDDTRRLASGGSRLRPAAEEFLRRIKYVLVGDYGVLPHLMTRIT